MKNLLLNKMSQLYNVVKAEFISMRLANLVGLNAASVSMTKSSNKDVLLIERFDRIHTGRGWQRKNMVSTLTLFGLDDWSSICGEAELADTDQTLLWSRQFLNSFAFDDLEDGFAGLAKIASDVRSAKM